MAQEWQPVDGAAKNDKGEFMANVGGQWQPVANAAKNDKGKYMALMNVEEEEQLTPHNPMPQEPTEKPMSNAEKKIDLAKGIMETPIALATGAIGAMAGGASQAITSAYEAGKEMLGGERTPNIAQNVGQDVAEKFSYQPKSQTGKAAVGAIGEVMSGFGVLPAIAEKMRDTERQLTGGRTIATDIALGALAAAPAIGKVKPEVKIMQERTKLYGKDVADAAYFMDKDFKIVPHEIKAGEKGGIAKAVEKIGGEKGVSDAISMHNQEIGNNVARKDIGLRADERLTPDALKVQRQEAFQPYEQVKNYGAGVGLKFKFDPQLYSDIRDISKNITGTALANERPTAETVLKTKRAVEDVQREIYGERDSKGKLSPAATIELIRDLRERSADTYKKREIGTDEKRIAKVQYEAANAMEDMLERRLTESGETQLLQQFKDARKKLSQLHIYSEIINPETGNVNIRKLAGKKYEKSPLTDGLKDLRKFAIKYPSSSKPESSQRPHGMSTLEAGIGTLGALKGDWTHTALTAGRAAMRPALTSKPIQRSAIPKLTERSIGNRIASAVTSKKAALAAEAIAEKKRRDRARELARLRNENK